MPLTRRNDVFHRASITNIPIISIHAREPQRSSFRSCSSPSRLAALVATAAPPGKPGGLPSEYRGPSRRIHPDGPRSNPRSPATPLTILIHRRCRSESLPDPHVGLLHRDPNPLRSDPETVYAPFPTDAGQAGRLVSRRRHGPGICGCRLVGSGIGSHGRRLVQGGCAGAVSGRRDRWGALSWPGICRATMRALDQEAARCEDWGEDGGTDGPSGCGGRIHRDCGAASWTDAPPHVGTKSVGVDRHGVGYTGRRRRRAEFRGRRRPCRRAHGFGQPPAAGYPAASAVSAQRRGCDNLH